MTKKLEETFNLAPEAPEKIDEEQEQVPTIEESKELAPKFNFDGLITATYQSRAGYADPVLTTKSLKKP